MEVGRIVPEAYTIRSKDGGVIYINIDRIVYIFKPSRFGLGNAVPGQPQGPQLAIITMDGAAAIQCEPDEADKLVKHLGWEV